MVRGDLLCAKETYYLQKRPTYYVQKRPTTYKRDQHATFKRDLLSAKETDLLCAKETLYVKKRPRMCKRDLVCAKETYYICKRDLLCAKDKTCDSACTAFACSCRTICVHKVYVVMSVVCGRSVEWNGARGEKREGLPPPRAAGMLEC